MPVLPALKTMFESQRGVAELPTDPAQVAELRAAMHRMMEESYLGLAVPHDPVAVERDIAIAVNEGAVNEGAVGGGEITLRAYRATDDDRVVPCHVHIHGGGFFLGNLDQGDTNCRALAADLDCVVVSVDYRLAPEHPFPAAANDAYAAVSWVAEHAAELRVDPARISVGGGSAGGNLAAVVALLARDRQGPALVAQVLEIPVTDFTSERALDFPDEGIHIDSAKPYAPLYLRDPADAKNPLASPLLADSLEGLPPALVMCAEYDQLQPEGAAYAERLALSGVPTTYRCWEGQLHGSQTLSKLIPDEAAAYHAQIVAFLADAYGYSPSRAE